MTGAEVAGAAMVGKVVEHVGKQASEERKAVNKELREGAKDSPYMEDASNSYAKRVAIRQAIMTQMYLPIAKLFGVANKYFEPEGQFTQDMGEKLKDVPEEHLVAPKASIAAPAMQQLGFSLDEPDLKEMYLNLLATASDDRSQDEVHPSFVEVIKQLSSSETGLLSHMLSLEFGGVTPIVSLRLVADGEPGWRVLQKHVMGLADSETGDIFEMPRLATYIENWVRLGLVSVSYAEFATGEGAYDWVETRPEYLRHSSSLKEGQKIDVKTGSMQPTSFGLAFGQAVGVRDK